MNLDPFFLDALLHELQPRLCGAVVNKVHQPGRAEIVLRLWNGQENLLLLLGVSPGAARVHLCKRKLPNPPSPPRFAQLLRSRLGRLTAIERAAGQRVVFFHFTNTKGNPLKLVADLREPQADLILVDQRGRCIDSLLRRSACGANQTYIPPCPPAGHFLLEGGMPVIPEGEPFASWLMSSVFPMNPTVARDLEEAERTGIGRRDSLERVRTRWLEKAFRPAVVRMDGKAYLCAWPPEFLEVDEVTTFPEASAAAETFYEEATGDAVFDARPTELKRAVRKSLKRLHRRLEKIAEDRTEALSSEREKQIGDLLLAERRRLQKGLREIVMEDWYSDPPQPVTIQLDPSLSPQENIERHFRRHRKGRRALEHVERRQRETQADMAWLEGIALALEEAEDPVEFQEIRWELQAEGVLPRRRAPAHRPSGRTAPAVRQATTPGGYLLYWGRNNRANDYVTRHLAEADDLWFHAHNQPGCHLVLKRRARGEEIPEADILVAAAAAAAFSRGKQDARVEVMMTEGKEVRKPRGARPGAVVVGRYRTMRVEPREIASSPLRS